MTYEFIFDIKPAVKERPRFSTRGGKMRTYTTEKTMVFENAVSLMARARMNLQGFKKLLGPISANVIFEFEKPKKTILASPNKDLDNLCKSLFDSLNEVVYDDDTQICSMMAYKRWGTKDRIKLLIGDLHEELK